MKAIQDLNEVILRRSGFTLRERLYVVRKLNAAAGEQPDLTE